MIALQKEDVDIGTLIERAKHPGAGAVVIFDGIVRDDDITEMELEAYEGVALAELERIAGGSHPAVWTPFGGYHPPHRAPPGG
jgi:molybdopterin synthase subunit MoaE